VCVCVCIVCVYGQVCVCAGVCVGVWVHGYRFRCVSVDGCRFKCVDGCGVCGRVGVWVY